MEKELFTALFKLFSSTPAFVFVTVALKVCAPLVSVAVGKLTTIDCHCGKLPTQLKVRLFEPSKP